jgi:hypothetical protein
VCNDCDNVCDILHSIDLLVVKLSMKFRPIFISVVYIPPSCSNTDYCAFVDFFISLSCLYGSDMLILGDFNITEFASCSSGDLKLTALYNYIDNLMNFYCLKQLNDVTNHNNRLLDLVFSNARRHV